MRVVNFFINLMNTIIAEISKLLTGFIAGFIFCMGIAAMAKSEAKKKKSYFDKIIDNLVETWEKK